MEIPQLTSAERFALATALDDRRFACERAINDRMASPAVRYKEIIANLDSARAKLAPLLENPIDPKPGISYKEREL